MPLISILLVIIIVGILAWLVNTYIPMTDSIKNIFNAVVVIGLVLWLLRAFGIWTYIAQIRI